MQCCPCPGGIGQARSIHADVARAFLPNARRRAAPRGDGHATFSVTRPDHHGVLEAAAADEAGVGEFARLTPKAAIAHAL